MPSGMNESAKILVDLMENWRFGPITIGQPVATFSEVLCHSDGLVNLHPGTDLITFGPLHVILYDGIVESIQLDFLGRPLTFQRDCLPKLMVSRSQLQFESFTRFLDSNDFLWWRDDTLSFDDQTTLGTESGVEIVFDNQQLFHILASREFKAYAMRKKEADK